MDSISLKYLNAVWIPAWEASEAKYIRVYVWHYSRKIILQLQRLPHHLETLEGGDRAR